jgi:hypothetical protein
MLSVTINVDDEGKFSVGVEPQGEAETEQGEGGPMDMMKGGQPEYAPAKNIDDALAQARQLLMQNMPQAEQIMRNEEAAKVWPGQKQGMMPRSY